MELSEIRFPVGSPLIIPSDSQVGKTEKAPTGSFDSIFSKEIKRGDVRVSSHAENRLRERGLNLTGDDISRIGGAMDTLASKGGRDSLVLMGGTALIVNVPNRTIITAMDAGNVFTNIDSAMILNGVGVN